MAEQDRLAQARTAAEQWWASHPGLTALDSTLASPEVQFVETPAPLKMNSGLRNVGRDAVFNLTLFGMQPGQVKGPVNGEAGSYIIQCLAVDGLDSLETAFANQLPQLRKDAYTTARNNAYGNWSRVSQAAAVIEDNRVKFGFDY